eukprot:3622562-Pyramimonas_sp.AAC.1
MGGAWLITMRMRRGTRWVHYQSPTGNAALAEGLSKLRLMKVPVLGEEYEEMRWFAARRLMKK